MESTVFTSVDRQDPTYVSSFSFRKEKHISLKKCEPTISSDFFKWFLPESWEAVDELEEMHMKVLSEMTDETTKSVGTVEVRGSKSGRIHTLLKTNECPLKRDYFNGEYIFQLPTIDFQGTC